VRKSVPQLVIVGCVGLIVGGCVLGYHWMTHSKRFAIAEMNVDGMHQLDQEQIKSLLALPENANIFQTDMGKLETLLETSPWISKAEVTRNLPDGLDIKIAEEKAVAAVELDGLYLVNEEGHPFKRVQANSKALDDLVIFTGVGRQKYLNTPAESEEELRYALRALDEFRNNPERPRLGEIQVNERHGLTLITYEDALAIHIGRPKVDALAGRFQTFDAAWQALDEEELAAARTFRIADQAGAPSDWVTIAFAGN
jgi:cell division protein FtsQ